MGVYLQMHNKAQQLIWLIWLNDSS